MTYHSVLCEEAVRPIIELAKKNLQRDGFLQPVLFVTLGSGQRMICGVDLPHDSEERPAYFYRLGEWFEREGKVVHEALFLSEGWQVNVQTSPGAFAVPPSRHPQREETISAIGCNITRTRMTSVSVPFQRGTKGELVWQPNGFAEYDTPMGEEAWVIGFLDDFFEGYLRQPPQKVRRD